ncbi:peptidoglycan DD-metalloendopeptidase family protein [Psittacicella hinzii]|uniref:Uncharacterized protein n=1 Tax=Psittacicella hinzii TaxID=2028575 RepID=A0A3A1YQD1_9GAMM|nr:peptidoglycan DD-metalloendopeptidase family protein [Psittacicella hinzii]RIY39459.1 hypothetical protein CKF58_02210 [Psittacicella hinzii]
MNNTAADVKRRRIFSIVVRLMYLIAFTLIGTGLYINYQSQINGLVESSDSTDYNNNDVDTSAKIDFQDISDIQTLSPAKADDLASNSRLVPLSLQKLNKDVTDLVNLVGNLKDPNSHEVKSNSESLEQILTTALRIQYPEATLNRDDFRDIIALSKRYKDGIDRLQKGQGLIYYFTEDGHISYISFAKTPVIELRYIRETDDSKNSYFREEQRRPTQKRLSVKPNLIVANGGLDATLRNLQIPSDSVRAISALLNWETNGRGIGRGANVTVLSYQEYVGDRRISDSFRDVVAVKVVQGGKSYYAIKYRNTWYNENGFKEQQPSFNRYPFNGAVPRITSGFNPTRRHPVTGRVTPHNGIDFGIPIRTPIYAPADGVVSKVTYQANGAGRYIVIQHNKTYSTVYMHLSEFRVSVGQKVSRGQLIAFSGNSGRTTGPHLHYEIHVNGVPRNPRTVALPQGVNNNVNGNKRFISLSKEVMSYLGR